MKFSQANSWKAHGVPFGAMVQDLEHRLMLISMIWRFQECHWDRWNRSGTLESISGEGWEARVSRDLHGRRSNKLKISLRIFDPQEIEI